METPNPDKEYSAEDNSTEQVELIKEIIGAAADGGKRYQRQLALAKTLLGREWRLSTRAILLVLVGVLLLTSVVATLWLTLNVLLAFGLTQLGLHWGWIGTGVIALNGLVLWGIVTAIRALLKHIGFSRTIDAFTLSTSKPMAQTNVQANDAV
jgi:hypothetical protein